MWGDHRRRVEVQASPRGKKCKKNLKAKRAVDVAQVAKHLPR
jgi:hypothetical protein